MIARQKVCKRIHCDNTINIDRIKSGGRSHEVNLERIRIVVAEHRIPVAGAILIGVEPTRKEQKDVARYWRLLSVTRYTTYKQQ